MYVGSQPALDASQCDLPFPAILEPAMALYLRAYRRAAKLSERATPYRRQPCHDSLPVAWFLSAGATINTAE